MAVTLHEPWKRPPISSRSATQVQLLHRLYARDLFHYDDPEAASARLAISPSVEGGPMQREILLGDEAIGLGAIHAGLSGVYAYPGTPSTEIFEFVERRTKKAGDVHAFWSTNEKVAYEEALGMSWAGKRALVCMKHVGLNVAADAFMNSAVTGTNGGLVLAVADDPGMHSSQNEQDSRYFAQFALIPCLEPRNQQECYDMMHEAFDMSEELSLPVMVRLVTRIAHSRSGVQTRDARAQNELSPSRDIKKWTLLPVQCPGAVRPPHRQAARTAPARRGLDPQPARAARHQRRHRVRHRRQLPAREPRGRPREVHPLHPPLPDSGGQGPPAGGARGRGPGDGGRLPAGGEHPARALRPGRHRREGSDDRRAAAYR
jgi:hypothetical protein